MKYKLTRKLVFYFTISLLSFAIIIGFTFSSMFEESTREQAQIELLERAQTIAQSVSTNLLNPTPSGSGKNQNSSGHMSGQHNSGNRAITLYLESLEATTTGEVWVVDKDLQAIDRSHGHSAISVRDLPEDGAAMLQEAVQGNIVFSEGFSTILNTESTSVGVPVYDDSNEILAVVLLHAPLSGIDRVIQQGYKLLALYIGIALIFSVALAYFLSMRFVKPLMTMRNVSMSIQSGDYSVPTNIKQSDEIGDLAHSIDTLALQLKKAHEERERLDHMRNEFFADISHELRTPVTVLSGSLESMKLSDLHDSVGLQNSIESMQNEVTHLKQLINDLLDFSKLNTTDFSLDKEDINLNDVIRDSIRSLRPLSQAKELDVEFTYDCDIYKYYGDYVRLRQMIMIVLDNAIKFSKPSDRITLSLKENQLRITDYGKGINPNDLPNIFNRFYKDEGTENSLGTGIGLAIAHQIALRHDIEIDVESELGKFTTFIFTFNN